MNSRNYYTLDELQDSDNGNNGYKHYNYLLYPLSYD